MAVHLLKQLPVPKNEPSISGQDFWAKALSSVSKVEPQKQFKEPPQYGRRQGFVPRKLEDFGDGGAFPEIHVAQYPMDLGRKENQPNKGVLPVNVDAQGNIAYDAIVKQGANAKKIVASQHNELVPKIHDVKDDRFGLPSEDDIAAATESTREALEKIVHTRLAAAQPKNVQKTTTAPTYIKYTPFQQGAAFNSGAKERVIRLVEMPQDPLEPPKFKHKRVPKGAGSPPVPVMHSPPRPVTVRDQQDWKIPPCISNWKNPKGYTIPLDKRLAADGRGLQEVQINDNFAKLSESLYVAEQKAREDVAIRAKIQRELMLKEKEKKESELRALAQRARMERVGGVQGAVPVGPSGDMGMEARRGGSAAAAAAMDNEVLPPPPRGGPPGESREERESRLQREAIRDERRRERERERRLEAKDVASGKKSKITRDRDRDVSEKVALGMASAGAGGGEVMYDQRLFNQEKGMDSGFGGEDNYNVYDRGLFASASAAAGVYRPRAPTDEELTGEGAVEGVMASARFKPDRGFAGAGESRGPRDAPVEFEQQKEVEADPFGLDQFLSEVRGTGKKLDKVGGGGTMRASAGGGGNKESYEGGSSRSRVDFQRGRN